MISIDDVATEDVIAVGTWGTFTAFNLVKLCVVAVSEPSTLQLLSPIVGTICGAVIGYRHVQNLAKISHARIERDRRRDEIAFQLKMAELQGIAKPAVEIPSDFPFDRKQAAGPAEDTVDMP